MGFGQIITESPAAKLQRLIMQADASREEGWQPPPDPKTDPISMGFSLSGFWSSLANWLTGKGWGLDKDKVADYMDNHANGTGNYGGHCARACRRGLAAGGLDTTGAPENAKDYGPFLIKHGASVVSQDNYKPEKGDVAVFQGGGRDKSGHIEIYDGKQWVSDTKQPGFLPRRDYPGGYTIYRFPGQP